MSRKVYRKSSETDEEGQRSEEKAPTLKTRRLCSIYHNAGLDSYKVADLDIDVESEAILLRLAQGVKGGERNNVVIGLSEQEALDLSKSLEVAVEILKKKKLEVN